MSDRAGQFLALAHEELAAARRLIAGQPRQAAYLLQQAAEKLAKARLIEAGVAPPRSHGIGYLASLLPVGHRDAARLAALDDLTVYNVAARYPLGDRLAPPPVSGHLEGRAVALAALLE